MMSPIRSVSKWMLACLLCASCEKSASLGSVCAEDRTRCEEVVADDNYMHEPERQEGVFETYPELEPVWIRDASASGGALADTSRLSAAKPDSLWIFEPTAHGLRVLGVDDEGELIEHAQLEPPQIPGAVEGDGSVPAVGIGYESSHARGPLLRVSWWSPVECSGEPEPNTSCANWVDQVLLFGQDPSAEPRRLTLEQPQPLFFMHANVVRSSTGDDLFGAQVYALSRYDPQGAKLWTQASGQRRFAVGEQSTSAFLQVAGASIDVLDEDRIAYLPFSNLERPSAQPEYWVVDGSGAVLEAHVLPAHDLLRSALFHTPNGDKLIAADTHNGDIVLLGIDADDHAVIFSADREDYTFQELLGASMDSDGTLYAATRAGGRAHADQVTVLCRLVDAREGSCFVARDVPNVVDIQATLPGILYTLSRDGSLRRFDFPE
jgi:hypothetical protein